MERAKPVPEPGERRIYQFGEFRVDPVRRRLLRGGEPVAVTSKCFSLLVVLLERQGEVVEKDELIKEVWPDTYVTEANLTQNVSSLRKALGERAGDRRYIVTIPGRGYSFVAEVSEAPTDASGVFPMVRLEDLPPVRPFPAPAPEPEPAAWETTVAELPRGPLPAPVEPAAVPGQAEPRRKPGLKPLGIALLSALAVVTLFLSGTREPIGRERFAPKAVAAAGPHRPAVAVMGFRDLAGNPETSWLGVALSEMLTTELAAGGQARLISGENVSRARQSLALPYTESLRGPDLARLRTILGADLVVVGAYLALDGKEGRQIRLDLRAVKLPDGEVVSTLSEVGKESDLFEIVTRAGERLRLDLGLHAPSAEQIRAVQALHPSLPEAARLTALGLARLRAFDPMGAVGPLQKAALIEPGSAVIHSHLARVLYDLGDDAGALREGRRALELSRPLSREERLAVEARFYATGKKWAQAAEIYRSLWTFYPDDIDHGLQLATMLINAGRGGEALEILATLRQTPAGRDDARIDLEEARGARRIADLATEARAAAAAAEKARRSGERLALARALIFQGDALLMTGKPREAAERLGEAEELARAVGHPWTAGMALSNLGSALQALGNLDEAELRHRQALDIARQLGSSQGIAAQLYTLALLQKDRGELTDALHLLEESLAVYYEIHDRLMQGRVLSAMAPIQLRHGDPASARRSADEAVAAAREVNNRSDEARALDGLAAVLSWQGDLTGARRQLDAALRLLLGFKNPSLATAVLASAADAQARLGDLDMAWRRLEQAVGTERRASDKMASGLLLGARARLALRTGDVKQARTFSEELLFLARKTGARTYEAWSFFELGRAQHAAGEISVARASFQSSLGKSTDSGDILPGAVVRLELARLDLAAARPREAEAAGREVAAWAAPRGFAWLEAQALTVVSDALLLEGGTAEATRTGERIRALLRLVQDRELILLSAGPLARIDAAAGDVDAAVRDLRRTIAEAEKIGHVPAALEARLALGEIEARNGRGDQTLRELQQDAEGLGFKDLARRAAA
jgi:DNA-binding winged helix-turn-helix (wHTH) protein/tetratricopeptide (TPR) repeat protein